MDKKTQSGLLLDIMRETTWEDSRKNPTHRKEHRDQSLKTFLLKVKVTE